MKDLIISYILLIYSKIHKIIWAGIVIFCMGFLKINGIGYWSIVSKTIGYFNDLIGNFLSNFLNSGFLMMLLSAILLLLSAAFVWSVAFIVFYLVPLSIIKSIDGYLFKKSVIASVNYKNIYLNKKSKGGSSQYESGKDYYSRKYGQQKTYNSNTSHNTYEDYYDEDFEDERFSGNQILGSELYKAKIFFGIENKHISLEELKKIRNKLIKEWHSDNGDGNDEMTVKINNYYRILKDNI